MRHQHQTVHLWHLALKAVVVLAALLMISPTDSEAQVKRKRVGEAFYGTYQGQNLYIRNPFHAHNPNMPHAVGLQAAWVNDIQVLDLDSALALGKDWSGAYEIALDTMGFRIGTPIRLYIEYWDNSPPRLLNPKSIGAEGSVLKQ